MTDLPQRKPLDTDEVRQLLRTCVTVVKPFEILFIRMGNDYTPAQLRELQEFADRWLLVNAIGVKALVFPGDAAEVVRQAPDEEQPEGELAKINQILREHGFEYPLASRGVRDLADGYRVRQEELHERDPEHWAAWADA